ncbi:MAG TPA: glycosyltransferase family 39 protein, partial [Chloroflexota bacterium]|nr:glycosyltransferase family 39 protein [Chloroflexota bacterium]
MTEKRWLTLILLLFVLLGGVYTFTTPVFEASDELWHYPMVRHLAAGNPLPVQVFDPAQAGPWKQEASQPPLYYYLGAALTFWIDTADMETVRWENPHVDNGIITADGNINLTIHNPAWNLWQGTLLAARLVRLFSILLGAATVYLTYRIAREVEPDRPEIRLGAAAINAFLPMFLFITASVNNDNLAIPLASLAILLMIRMIRNRYSVTRKRLTNNGVRLTNYELRWLLIGVVIGLAILTKEGTFGLFPIALGTAFISQWQKISAQVSGKSITHHASRITHYAPPITDYRLPITDYGRILLHALLTFLVMLLPVALIAGWWYWRNIRLYGDFLGWNAFIAVLGQRATPASLYQLWSERHGFLMSYWGLFGGVNVPMPGWIYALLNGVLVVSVVGFVIYIVKEMRDWRLEVKGAPFNLQSLISNLLRFVERYFALIVCLLFSAAVVVGLIQWA